MWFTLQACNSNYKHLHGQKKNASIFLDYNRSVKQIWHRMVPCAVNYSNGRYIRCCTWHIELSNTLLTKLEAIECYHIPPMTFASAWIWTRLESTKISPTSFASARILNGFGRIFSSLKATMSFVYYIQQQVMFYLIPYNLR